MAICISHYENRIFIPSGFVEIDDLVQTCSIVWFGAETFEFNSDDSDDFIDKLSYIWMNIRHAMYDRHMDAYSLVEDTGNLCLIPREFWASKAASWLLPDSMISKDGFYGSIAGRVLVSESDINSYLVRTDKEKEFTEEIYDINITADGSVIENKDDLPKLKRGRPPLYDKNIFEIEAIKILIWEKDFIDNQDTHAERAVERYVKVGGPNGRPQNSWARTQIRNLLAKLDAQTEGRKIKNSISEPQSNDISDLLHQLPSENDITT